MHTDAPETEAAYRLPRTVVPVRYDLEIAPDLEAGTFAGVVEVQLEVREPVDQIVLNAAELQIDAALPTAEPGPDVEVVEVRQDPERQRVHLRLARRLEPGPARLRVEFRGHLNERMYGLYRSTYTDDAGERRVLAATQFESTDARSAFPCWDEPDLKAVFAISLVIPEGMIAVSNGPEVERTSLADGRVRVRFGDTMPMSTYLVAFVVGPLEIGDPLDVDGVPLRMVYVPGKAHLATYALEVGAFSLRFFTEYYGIPYPGEKLDMIALPDFAQGAMENLGCITYRESLLLIDPDKATQPELQNVADTVAHEIAHMWFGDLVTMRWWNGVWLNEAFATFMELACTDAFRPEWRRWHLFARSRSVAFEVDALATTRPIEYPVHSPDDAAGMFDVLTYTKGASVLRMLEQYLGDKRFRDGIRRYLGDHRLGNTETSDLWDAIERATGEPVRRIMDSWIWQGGFPLVSASIVDGEVRLGQRRFRYEGESGDQRWEVPLLVRHGAAPDAAVEPVLVDREPVSLRHPEGEAVVANAGGHGFVRVTYADELRKLLGASLHVLSSIERYQLIDDAWAAVLAGDGSAASFCRLARDFSEETDLAVWQALLVGLEWCERRLSGVALEGYRGFLRELLRPTLDRLGWEPVDRESDLARTLRGTLFQDLGVLGRDPEVQALAREIDSEARSGASVEASLASAAVSVLASSGGREEFEAFLRAKGDARTPQEELRYLYALPGFRDQVLLDRTLDLALTDEVRPQNLPWVLTRAIANREHGRRAWGFVRDRWDEIVARIAPSIVIYVAHGVRSLTDPGDVKEVQDFFAEHPIPQSALQLEQILEMQRVFARAAAKARPALEAEFAG